MAQAADSIQVTDEPPSQPRHSFYETDEKLTLDIFDKGVNPGEVSIKFEPRTFIYENGTTTKLVLQPLKGEIDTDASSFTVGKVKVEIKLVKRVQGRWGILEGDSPDGIFHFNLESVFNTEVTILQVLAAPTPFLAPSTSSVPQVESAATKAAKKKDWERLTKDILESDKEKSLKEDPNVGGDSTVNGFFQQLFANADEDTKRAMMKSYVESGGTTLSTNWEEVGKGPVGVKPPQGLEWKRWD
ncbi:hypothetical protein EW145_g793 [Phellinidium pouzarii]|uniref:SGS domain-containing protein n=1 Tax=Phellinidium pouzarii TaxID=167371 RepID=A0A4S4LME9_9AGAM|nr:hypothetical protein EW145_g793 [Phellinidium pouzarii]